MKARTLLDNFDLIADAPGGVPKLRELILQLAVRGKLVPQDSKDIAAQVTGSDVTTETEPKYAIPAKWIWTQLGCVIDYNYGGKTESERIPADAWLLDLEDIEKDTSRLLQRVLAGDRKSTSTKSQFSAGDVLYGKLRPYLNKVLVANSDGYCTTEIVPMKPLKGVNPHFVVCVLKSRDFLDYTAARSYGMKMPRLGTEDAKRAPFPLPPLPEQKRIVAKVDELMKRCDELENRQKERSAHHKNLVASCLNAVTDPKKPNPHFIIHNSSFNLLFSSPESITELRKTILQLAVRGRLVLQDPKEESAAKLFKRIQSEQAKLIAEGICKSFKPLPQFREDDKPFQLSPGWEWFRLRELVFTLGDGLHGTPEYSEGTQCYFINGNNFKDGQIVIKPHTKTVSVAEMQKHRKFMTLNTVLVSINGTLGSVAFYNNENVILGKSACYFNLSSFVDKHFMRLVIESPCFISYATDNATGSTIRNLGLKAMNLFPVPLPPLSEQKRIVAKVNELMVMCDELEAKLTQSNAVAEKLAEAMVLQTAL